MGADGAFGDAGEEPIGYNERCCGLALVVLEVAEQDGRVNSAPCKRFSLKIPLALPFNHAPEYPEWLREHCDGLAEVYFPLHGSVVGSGRPWQGPTSKTEYQQELRRLACALNSTRTLANIVVNSLVPPDHHSEVIRAVADTLELFDQAEVTICDLEFGRALRGAFPDLRLGVSTFANIDSVAEGRLWRHEIGAEVITVGREINRRPAAIGAMRALDVELKLVLNDLCVPGCPAFLSHLVRLAMFPARDPHLKWCSMRGVVEKQPWRIAQKDIVPAVLPRYEGLIDIAKIAGREASLEALDRILRAYREATSYTHPLRIYEEPPEAHARIIACDRDCEACGWCPEHFPEVPCDDDAPAPHGEPETILALGMSGPQEAVVAIHFDDSDIEAVIMEAKLREQLPKKPFERGSRFGLLLRGGDGKVRAVKSNVQDVARALLAFDRNDIKSLLAAWRESALCAPDSRRGWWIQVEGGIEVPDLGHAD